MNESRSERRLWRHPYVAVAAAVLFASAIAGVGGTLASFSAETQNKTSTFAGGWLSAPAGLTVTPSGYDAQLAWTPGTHGLDGQQLWGFDNGSSATCPANGYTLQNTMAAATTASYTKSYSTNALNGHYLCYEMLSTRTGSSWTATGSFPATQLGLVATAASESNGGSSGSIDKGDSVTITFNQQTNVAASGSLLVCSFTDGTVLLGDSAGFCQASSDAYSLAKLTLGSGSIAKAQNWTNSSVAVTAAAPWNVTVTLSANKSASLTTPGTWTLTPSTSVLSQATTDQATACTSSAYNCTPATASAF